MRYATLAAPVACGNYVVRSQVLTADPLNPAGTGDDQNGWRIRVGTDNDAVPTNPPPANSDNPDALVGTNDELTLGLDQASFQQDSGALACQTFFEYVSPGQASIAFNNFDMDGNTRVRYYAPSDASYDPNANSGGTLGTLSNNGVWNGGTLATRVGDTILNPESGWWRFVTCISTQNQFIQEGEAGRAAYYTQPPTPRLTIAKSDGLASVAPGQLITYTIDVNNVAAGATAGAADNVVVHDILPGGVTYQSCGSPVPAQGTWACSESGGNVTFTQNGWINAGAAAQLTVTARVNQSASGSILNTATADYQDEIGNPFLQASATDTDTIAPSADLSITKSDGVVSVTAGTSTTYAITLTNNGPTDEPAGAIISDTIPAGVDASESEPNCAKAAGVFSCTTAAVLASGASVSYQLTLAILPSYALATLSNTASITFTPVPDPDASNDVATDVDSVVISADLSIAKADSADPVDPGTSFDYTLTVTNNGPSDASALTVSDTLPAGFAISSVTSGAGTCGNVGNVATCTRASLPAGGTWVIMIAVDVDPLAGGGLYTDTATVSATSPDPVSGNDSDSETTIVTPAGDLELTKSDGVASVTPGASTTYTITLTNNGPSDVPAGVVVSDPIPADTVGSESEPNCSIAAGVFSCTTTATLVAGASVVYRLTLALDPAYPSPTLANTVTITASPVADPGAANNTATDTDAVTPIDADLSIVKTDSADPVQPGDTFSYTIAITNAGPDDARDVVLSDPIPAALTVAGVSSSGTGACVAVQNMVTCSIDPLVAGAVWTVTVQVTVPPDALAGTVTNTATVAGVGNTDTSNDAADQTTTIGVVAGSADLTVAKTVDDATPNEGDTVTYTVMVSNAGPDDATGVQVADVLPAGLTFVSTAATQGSYDAATGEWLVGALAVGDTAFMQILAKVDDGTVGHTITNRADLSAADLDDPNPGDDADSAPIVVEAAGGGTQAGGGTASTGFPGSSGAIAWMFALAMLGLAALGLAGRRRGAVRSIASGGSGGDSPGRFLCEPFFYVKE
jgi:uncharacterized repeat protein (TIGR01451 family)